ncbi:MAG: Uncharacterised protein [Synechococcus sp. MIT S9220]|nr:MAG: Uncharacterised protein [Synechococcus sp. MIT S9220]
MADILHRRIQTILRRYKELGREDVDGFKTLQDFAGGGVDVADRLHLITEQLHPNETVFISRPDFQHIALDAEASAGDVHVIAAVLVIHQFAQRTPKIKRFTNPKLHRCLQVFTGYSQAIDATDGSHNNHIAAFKQRSRR